MIGRLKAGVTEQQAAAEMQVLSSQLEQQYPRTDAGRTAVLAPTRMIPTEDRGWMSLLTGGLLAIGILILVVACANVANLLLGLSTARRHEMLVRAALGASRRQLMVPVLRESVTLAVVAGVIGDVAAREALVWLSGLKPAFALFPTPSIDLRPDLVVTAATVGLVVVSGLTVGLLPAWRSAAHGLSGALNRESIAAEPNRGRTRSALVITQMAIAILVLVAMGISVQSLLNLERAPLGFSARNLRFALVLMGQSGYDERTGPPLYERIRRRIGAIPGVEAVSLIDGPPLFNGRGRDYVMAEHEMPGAAGRGAETRLSVVDSAYFSTLGIDLRAGRTFDTRDRSNSPEVVVINETMARRHWAGRDPIGQRLRIENGNRLVQVIGVVADGKYDEIDEDQLPFMYFSLDQHYLAQVVLAVRLEPASAVSVTTMTKALREMEPNLGAVEFGGSTFDDLLALHLYLPRLIVKTVSVFGGFTLVLAVVGLYSSVFYSVSQRRGEIGIRIALGAQPRDLFLMVLRETTWLALGGAAVGTAAGLALLPLVASAFYGIRPVEPVVIAVVACVSVLVSLLTAYIAARPLTRMSAAGAIRWNS
jgi:putative ABC transport system permease protein